MTPPLICSRVIAVGGAAHFGDRGLASTFSWLGYYLGRMSGREPTEPASTTEEMAVRPRVDARRSVLIVVGEAGEGGGMAGGERLIPFEHAVEIGRQPRAQPEVVACTLRDPRVSGRHARVERTQKQRFQMVDLSSKNGTLVEGRMISGPTKIENGSLLFVGRHTLMVRVLSKIR